MEASSIEQFSLSQSGVLIRDGRCLIFEDASHPGIWILPGGRINKNESCEEAFKREIKEKLGITSFQILALVDFDTWYDDEGNAKSAVVRLIKNDKDEIKMSREHLQLKWITEDEIESTNFLWPNADRMIRICFEVYNKIK